MASAAEMIADILEEAVVKEKGLGEPEKAIGLWIPRPLFGRCTEAR